MKETWGGLLLAVGILIAGGSGLCSMAVLFTPGEYSGWKMWPTVALVGGIPFAVGTAIALGGRALILSGRGDVRNGGEGSSE
jgi:hypothetical protein